MADPRDSILLDLSDRVLELLPPCFHPDIDHRWALNIRIHCYFNSIKECEGLHWMHIFLYKNAHNNTGICARYEARSWHVHLPKSGHTFAPTAELIGSWWPDVVAWGARERALLRGAR